MRNRKELTRTQLRHVVMQLIIFIDTRGDSYHIENTLTSKSKFTLTYDTIQRTFLCQFSQF